MIPANVIDQIKDGTDLPSLVREYGVALRPVAGGFLATCPFHQEKTPSFRVNVAGERRGTYHCFGCSATGDAINFLMRIESIPFPAAAERLALRAGISITHPRQTAVARIEESRDREMSVWWWQRRWQSVRDNLDASLVEDDAFALCCGRMLRWIEGLRPEEKISWFRRMVTVAEREEWRREKAHVEWFMNKTQELMEPYWIPWVEKHAEQDGKPRCRLDPADFCLRYCGADYDATVTDLQFFDRQREEETVIMRQHMDLVRSGRRGRTL